MRLRTLLRRLRRFVTGAGPVSSTHKLVTAQGRLEPSYFYLEPHVAMTRLHDGHFLYVDPRDETISAHLIARGFWEPWIHKVVCDLIRKGDHVIEVGANVGYYTVGMALKVGSEGTVISLEANPVLAALVRRSTIFNGYRERVVVLQKAASDQSGTLTFTSSLTNSGGGHVYVFDDALGPDSRSYEVEAVRLDDLDVPSPRFLRLDAEGSEGLILQGAERLLSREDIVVCMEWDPIQLSDRTDPQALLAWLAGKGFQFWRINEFSALIPVTSTDLMGLQSCDIIVSRALPIAQP